MRVIFLNRFYWPQEPATAQLLTDLAGALAARGCDVTVITSHPGDPGLPCRQSHCGVNILRLRSTRWAGIGLAGKAADFGTFLLAALWRLGFIARRGDRIIALTDPPFLGVGAWLVARLRGARIYHWVQDIYPEIAIALTGHGWLRALRPLRNLAWRRSDGCVTLGSDMAVTLARVGVPVERIILCPNWAPSGLAPQPSANASRLRADWQLEGKFVIAYAGNLGRVHDLDPVLDLAAALRDDPGIAFVFIGAGAQRASLEARAVARGLANVGFHPPQPRARLAATLALGDVHLVTLLAGCEQLVFPSKLYGVAAIGRPVVFLGPRGCELARLVEQGGFGLAFTRDEIAAAAASLRQLQGDPAMLARLGTAAEQFGRASRGPDAAVAVWEKLLNSGS